MKLYRDGSVGAFSNYKKAISLAATFGAIASTVTTKLLIRELDNFDTLNFMEMLSLYVGLFFIFSILMFIVYRRPLLVLDENKFKYFTGIFSSDYILIKELKKFKIFADKDSISVDIYNKANLRVTFETRAIENLELQIKGFIEENLNLEVDCVNLSNEKALNEKK